jgi:hypothetical protein
MALNFKTAPVRPQVDAYLLDWITRQPLRREWFCEQRDGNCRLNGPFTVRLSETAPIWGRAVAPMAPRKWQHRRSHSRWCRSPTDWPLIAILGMWVCGFGVISLMRFRTWLRIRAAVRSSTSLAIPAVVVNHVQANTERFGSSGAVASTQAVECVV